MLRRYVVPLLALSSSSMACSGSFAVEPRLVAVQNALSAVGFTQSGQLSELSLGSGEEVRVPIDLESIKATNAGAFEMSANRFDLLD